MYFRETNYEILGIILSLIITVCFCFVKEKCGSIRCRIFVHRQLSLAEGLAVGALILRGIGLVSTHQDPVQRAKVLAVTVIGAGLHGAFNTLVCMVVHRKSSFVVWYSASMASFREIIRAGRQDGCFFSENVVRYGWNL